MTHMLRDISKLPLAFGGASISGEGGGYGFGHISEGDSISLLKDAYEGGFRIFDAAPIYGFGLAEKRMGKAFAQNREDVFFISKSGVTWNESKRVDMSNSKAVTQKMLEQSLRDFNTDYIDLFMIHWPDAKVDIREPLEVLSKAKSDGKIKHIGLCNTSIEDLEKASEIERIEVAQSQLNVFCDEPVNELFPYLKEKEMSFMSWGTLDKGIITGSIHKKREQSKSYDDVDCRKKAPWWNQAEVLEKVSQMDKAFPILEEHGHTGLELALGYNLSFDSVSTALVGARNHDQLQGCLKALSNLPSEVVLEKVLKAMRS